MSNNIHGLDNYSQNGQVGIHSSNSVSNKDDRIFISSLYKIRSVTFFLLALIISIYIFQLLAFYMYFNKNGNSWSCLLITFGAFQGSRR